MQILSYSPQFKQQVIKLILYIQNQENSLNLTLEEQPDLNDIEGTFLNGKGGFWIALEDGKVVGTIGLKRVSETGAILKKFFVSPDKRGSGIGLRLYEKLVACSEETGVQKIILDTPAVATRSHAFYKKAGFVQITKDELPFPYEYPDRNSLLFLKEIESRLLS